MDNQSAQQSAAAFLETRAGNGSHKIPQQLLGWQIQAGLLSGDQKAWIGVETPTGFTSLPLAAMDGFHAPASHHNQYQSVWLVETAVSIQGWKILIDSAIRLLQDDGLLVVRYTQNENISIINLKSFLFRKFGIAVSIVSEEVRGGTLLTAFRIQRKRSAARLDKRWTFGVLTQGKKVDVLRRFCRSVRTYGGDEHEILIVGPRCEALAEYNPTYIDKQYHPTLAEICVKKNDIVAAASHPNICIVHDRYVLNPDFFSGFEQYGYDFDYVTIRQYHESGKVYPSYCAVQDRGNLIWGRILDCQNQNETWTQPYLNGGLLIGKRDLLLAMPFNDLLFHNQAEDVELAKLYGSISVVPRINTHSSAVTEVEDHLTDAFLKSSTTDYGQPQDFGPWEPNPKEKSPFRRALKNFTPQRIIKAPGRAIKKLIGKTRRLRRKLKHLAFPRKRLQEKPDLAKGVNVLLMGQSQGAGVLNVAEFHINTLLRQNIPVCVVNLEADFPGKPDPRFNDRYVEKPIYPTNLWHVGFPFFNKYQDDWYDLFTNHWNINFTSWELPAIPQRLATNFQHLDEVIVHSPFVADAIKTATDLPVEVVDLEVSFPENFGAKYDRKFFGLPENKVLFLINWEFTSWTYRKNPDAAINAFRLAFADVPNEVALVLHARIDALHGAEWLQKHQDFVAAVRAENPNVIFLTEKFDYEQAIALKRECDCYVSLHRSEGYGMGCAESLSVGSYCIMTNWSGNLVVLDNPNWAKRTFPVDYRLVPVKPEDFPWVAPGEEAFQHWADANVEHAAQQMRRVYELASVSWQAPKPHFFQTADAGVEVG